MAVYNIKDFSGDGGFDFTFGSCFGVRQWIWRASIRVSGDTTPIERRLTGVREAWTSDTFKATCQVFSKTNHKVPAEDCSCGIYSYHSLDEVMDTPTGLPKIAVAHGGLSDASGAALLVFTGVVENYGRVLIGDLGVRSEFAKIKGLYMHSMFMDNPDIPADGALYKVLTKHTQSVVERVSELYGTPVYPSLEKLVSSHPLSGEYYHPEAGNA